MGEVRKPGSSVRKKQGKAYDGKITVLRYTKRNRSPRRTFVKKTGKRKEEH